MKLNWNADHVTKALEWERKLSDRTARGWEDMCEDWLAMNAVLVTAWKVIETARHHGCEQCKGFDASVEIDEALAEYHALVSK